MTAITVCALVGHLSAPSRTRAAAESVAGALAAQFGANGPGAAPVEVLELAPVAGVLMGEGGEPARLREQVAAADVLIVASPTFKATYTGLLKVFLDGYDGAGLRGCVAVPLMVYGAPHHAMAADWHLRPLLIELGASCPTAALAIDQQVAPEAGELAEAFAEANWAVIAGAVEVSRPRRP